MRIDHIALCVRDLEAMRDFYIEHFGAPPGNCTTTRAPGCAPIFSPLTAGRAWN